MKSQSAAPVLIVFALLLAAFFSYAEDVILGSRNGPFYGPPTFLQKIDLEAYRWIETTFASSLADKLFPVLTLLGSTPLWFGACATLWLTKKRRLAIILAISLLIGSLATFVIKAALPRERPMIALGIHNPYESDLSASFPSGHAKNVFTGAALIGGKNIVIKALMYAIAFAVSLSRIYLALHWPSDVFAGALLGWSVAHLVDHWRIQIISKILGP